MTTAQTATPVKLNAAKPCPLTHYSEISRVLQQNDENTSLRAELEALKAKHVAKFEYPFLGTIIYDEIKFDCYGDEIEGFGPEVMEVAFHGKADDLAPVMTDRMLKLIDEQFCREAKLKLEDNQGAATVNAYVDRQAELEYA